MWPRPLSINAAFRSSMERRAASGILSLLHTRINEGKSSVMSESSMPFSWSPKKTFPHLSLAKEIKILAGEVDTGINDVEDRASQLSGSIQASQQTLGQEAAIVSRTDESFQKITSAAEGAVAVQSEISGVIGASQQELLVIRQFFDQIKGQYQEVLKHIDSASRLGTTKSAMFEDIDNMLSQIPLIIKDKYPEGV